MSECMCGAAPTLLYPCSGGSNVGQIANDAARQLTRDGKGKLSCLAGIGGQISGMIESAKAGKVVAIDGCPLKCSYKTLDHAGIQVNQHIVLTECGFEKNRNLCPSDDEVALAISKILPLVKE